MRLMSITSDWEVVVQADGQVRSRPYRTFPFAFETLCEPLSTMMYDRLRDLIDSVRGDPKEETD